VPPSCRQIGTGAATLTLIVTGLGCAPDTNGSGPVDPSAVTGELVTYVADFNDGHSESWHAVRTQDRGEVRLDFDTPPTALSGSQIRVHGDWAGERLHVRDMDVLPGQPIGAAAGEPPTFEAPATDTFALVLVDLGTGVDITAAQAQTALFAAGATDKSFANYYKEVSHGKYQLSGDVIGPFPYSMSSCDTTGMYTAVEKMITGTYNHLIYYFKMSSLCNWGGLGEEGSSVRPAKRTWMNGSLSCVVLMQEPGHNLGLMHANTMKCGSSSFSTTPAQSCTITEYGSSMSTMGGGCRQFNAYERWYMQWLTGCNGVRVPSEGTFNLVPLENDCSDGSAVQVLQVPFPKTLAVSDPQSTNTTVNLNDYYVELRTSGGIFDSYSSTTSRGQGSSVSFTGPTVFVYASDNVRIPTTSTRGSSGMSVWTELLNMSPSGTTFTGLTMAGQSFVDPAGGPTITLQSISATGATVSVTYPNGNGSGAATCIDGSTPTAPGPTTCGAAAPGTGGTPAATGGTSGAAGAPGTGGMRATGGAGGGAAGRPGTGGGSGAGGKTGTGGTGTLTGSGGITASGTGGKTGTGGQTGTGGNLGATAGTDGSGPAAEPDGTVVGGCACTTGTGAPATGSAAWLALAVGLTLLRPRRRSRRA
jgi:MYXO-CTERM domain-containing protein